MMEACRHGDKPHIAKLNSGWAIYRSREKRQLMALAERFTRLNQVGPWRPAMTLEDFSGAKTR